jgi:hypothetical protein
MKTFPVQIKFLLRCLLVAMPLANAFQPASARAGNEWDVSVLDKILASLASDETIAPVGDMGIPVSYLRVWRDRLAGGPQPNLAFSGSFTPWTGGNVYYVFSNNVSVAKQKACLDGMAEWAMFANLNFSPRTVQPNYVTIYENPALNGGQSAVGMVGGQQFLQIGPTSWNRPTIVHELGHTLGLVHEQQRSDRTNFVTLLTNNITPGSEGNFVLLTGSQNKGAYDFLSVMHYSRNLFSINPGMLDTLQPLPAYAKYLNLMGQQFDPVLSPNDRAGVAQVYGAGPTLTSVVTNTLDTGPGSLRAALYYAFDHPGTTVTFNIPVTDGGFSNTVFNIQPSDALPGLWNVTTLDANTEPTNSNPSGPEILLDGRLLGPLSVYASGLRFRGTNCVARGFTINRFPFCGALLDGSNTVGNTLAGCYLGTDPTGTVAVTNGVLPVQISGGAVSNTVGGATVAARNVIGGSVFQGLVIRDAGTRGNLVAGNFIGLNAAGTGALPNNWAGIEIFGGAQSNLVGGYNAAARNVVSGNSHQGVAFSGTGTGGNIAAGNYIGLNAAGTAALPNAWAGAECFGGAQGNFIGGTVAGAGNVISGNSLQGVALDGSGTSGNRVQGNFIGVNPAGTAAIGNGYAGANFFGGATGNFVGGNVPGAGNLISGNKSQGVLIQDAGTGGNFVQGNWIGLNAAGSAAISNHWSGVEIYNGPAGNLIGGYGGARNFISGNGNYGVAISFGSSLNLVQGNTIGLNATNGAAVPNTWAGVLLYVAASNTVGGVSPGAANLIAGNLLDGVQVQFDGATNNTIRGNSIFNNSGNAIFNYSGGNNLLAAPTLTSAVVGTNTVVAGNYNGGAGKTFLLDFYSDAPPAPNAESQTYFGTISVVGTGASAAFTASLGALLPAGRAVTATATDPAGNTSQLSTGIAAAMSSTPGDGIPDVWRIKFFAAASTNSQSAWFADPDHDGLNNLQEFLAGTNPTNAASVFKLAALNPKNSTNVVSLNSASGIVYRILSRDDLIAGNWAILADQIIGTGTNIFFSDLAAPAAAKRLYRAQVLW